MRNSESRPRIDELFFPGTLGHGTKVRQMGQDMTFSRYGGTAGQKGLNVIDRTINCPTKVSHFRDARDTWDKWDKQKLPSLSGRDGRRLLPDGVGRTDEPACACSTRSVSVGDAPTGRTSKHRRTVATRSIDELAGPPYPPRPKGGHPSLRVRGAFGDKLFTFFLGHWDMGQNWDEQLTASENLSTLF